MTAKLYAEILACGVIVLLLMLVSMRRNMTVLLGEKLFSGLILSQCAILVIDGLAKIPVSSSIFIARPLVIAANTAYYFQLGVVGFFWLVYADYRINTDTVGLAKRLILYILSAGSITMLSFVNIFTGWVFFIDENNRFVRGDLYIPISVAYWVLMFIPTIVAVQRALNAPLSHRRRDYIFEALYIVPPLIGWLVQVVYNLYPFAWVMTVCAMLLNFFEMQGRQISIDALTGVNNRRTFNRYLETFVENPRRTSLALFIIDINNFKEINDTYGHMAGDEMLKLFASILRKVCGRRNCFLARYGGDEFAVVCIDTDPVHLEGITSDIKREVDLVNALSERPYKLSISIGFSICSSFTAEDIEELIETADRNMYINKRKYKSDKNAKTVLQK